MKFWYIQLYGASFGDDIDAKMNLFQTCQMVINSTFDAHSS